MEDVGVARVDLFLGGGDRNLVFCSVSERVFAAADIPFAPWRDDRKVRRHAGVGELEADLIVAFAGASVSQRVSADPARDFYLAFRDQRARNGRAEHVFAAVNRASAEHRIDVFRNELLAEVLDVTLVSAGGDGLFAHALELTV